MNTIILCRTNTVFLRSSQAHSHRPCCARTARGGVDYPSARPQCLIGDIASLAVIAADVGTGGASHDRVAKEATTFTGLVSVGGHGRILMWGKTTDRFAPHLVKSMQFYLAFIAPPAHPPAECHFLSRSVVLCTSYSPDEGGTEFRN